jgi:hypothetical protein
MRFNISFISVAALALILVNTAWAAGQSSAYPGMKDPGSAQQQFSQLDKNKDSSISKAEAKNSPALASNFKEIDKNGDHGIDSIEFNAFEAKQMGGQPGSQGGSNSQGNSYDNSGGGY